MPKFPEFLGTLLCEQQDQDTVHELATHLWHQTEPQELVEKCTTVVFTRTGTTLHCAVSQLDAETGDLIGEEHWRIEAHHVCRCEACVRLADCD